MLDARFSHLYIYQSLYTLQRGLPAIAGLLVLFNGAFSIDRSNVNSTARATAKAYIQRASCDGHTTRDDYVVLCCFLLSQC